MMKKLYLISSFLVCSLNASQENIKSQLEARKKRMQNSKRKKTDSNSSILKPLKQGYGKVATFKNLGKSKVERTEEKYDKALSSLETLTEQVVERVKKKSIEKDDNSPITTDTSPNQSHPQQEEKRLQAIKEEKQLQQELMAQSRQLERCKILVEKQSLEAGLYKKTLEIQEEKRQLQTLMVQQQEEEQHKKLLKEQEKEYKRMLELQKEEAEKRRLKALRAQQQEEEALKKLLKEQEEQHKRKLELQKEEAEKRRLQALMIQQQEEEQLKKLLKEQEEQHKKTLKLQEETQRLQAAMVQQQKEEQLKKSLEKQEEQHKKTLELQAETRRLQAAMMAQEEQKEEEEAQNDIRFPQLLLILGASFINTIFNEIKKSLDPNNGSETTPK